MLDVRETAAGAADRVRTHAAPAVEAALGATAAWWVAATVLQVPQNFFAPIAAIAVVLGGRGGRGPRALRVITGGVVGVGFGELALLTGPHPLAVFAATAAAVLAAAAITADALIMIQSGIGAVLVPITASPLSGVGRAGAALIGGLVALVVTQVLCTPSPGRLAGPPVSKVLGAAAGVLDDPRSDARVRDLVRALAGLDDVHDGLRRIGRFTLRGRVRPGPVQAMSASTAAASELALDVLARAGRARHPAAGQRTGPAPGRAVALRDLAVPASRAGRPGRRVPAADEIRSLLAGDADGP